MTALLWLAIAAQDEVGLWIERLSSSSIEERTEAARRLKEAGPRAFAALERAAASPDPERSARATQVLRALRIRATLPEALRRLFPEVEDRLASDPGAWMELLLEASRTDRGGRRVHAVTRSDLDAISAQAWREAVAEGEVRAVRGIFREWGLAGAAPAVAESLSSPDDALVREAVECLVDLEARPFMPAVADLLKRAGARDAAKAALACLPHPEALAQVRRSLDEDEALTEDALAIVQAARDRDAVPALRRRLKDPRPSVRIRVLQILCALEAPDLEACFREALRDSDAEVRQEALKGLGDRPVAGLEAELHAMFRDPDRGCRISALKRIKGAPHPPALPDLLDMLAGGDLAMFAAEVLGAWAYPAALPEIRRLLREGNPADRKAAAWSVWGSAPAEVVPELVALLDREEPDLRSAALEALVRLRARPAADRIVLLMKRDGVQRLRERAAEALLALDHREAIPDIASLLRGGESAVVHGVLERFGGPEVVQALRPRLGALDPDARRWTATLLGRIGDPSAGPAVRRLLDDDHPAVVLEARVAVARRATAREVSELLEWLDLPDWTLRHAILDALARLDAGDAAVPRLVGWLRDRWEREVVLRRLAAFHAPRAGPVVASLVRQRREGIAAPAAEILAWWGGEGVDEVLLEALESTRMNVRRSAAWGLSQRRVKAAVPLLIALLEDPDPVAQQRGWVCQALGELGDPAAVPALLRELEGTDCRARALAARALGLLEAVDAAPRLRRLAEEPERCRHGGGAVAVDELGSEVAGPVRHEAAKALVRMGDDGALEAVFSLGPLADLSVLNRLRRPEAWARLWSARMAHAGPAGRREWPALLAAAGLTLEAPEALRAGAAFDVLEDSLWGRGGREMACRATAAAEAGVHDILLEDDRVRIIDAQEARRFWDAWKAGR